MIIHNTLERKIDVEEIYLCGMHDLEAIVSTSFHVLRAALHYIPIPSQVALCKIP